jgi:hypothetical protein
LDEVGPLASRARCAEAIRMKQPQLLAYTSATTTRRTEAIEVALDCPRRPAGVSMLFEHGVSILFEHGNGERSCPSPNVSVLESGWKA